MKMGITSNFVFVQVLPTQSHTDHSIPVFKFHASTQQVQFWTIIRNKNEKYISRDPLNSIHWNQALIASLIQI